MTDEQKAKWGVLFRTVATAIGGGLLTLLFMTLQTQNSNSQRISRLEGIVEMMKDTPQKLAELTTKADRNYDLLQETHRLMIEHIEKK